MCCTCNIIHIGPKTAKHLGPKRVINCVVHTSGIVVTCARNRNSLCYQLSQPVTQASYAVAVVGVVFRLTCRSVVCQVATAKRGQMAAQAVCDVTLVL